MAPSIRSSCRIRKARPAVTSNVTRRGKDLTGRDDPVVLVLDADRT
jgi:hypothetical protein